MDLLRDQGSGHVPRSQHNRLRLFDIWARQIPSFFLLGTMPPNVHNQPILSRRVRSFENGSVPHLARPSPYRSSSISTALAAAAAVSAPALTSAQPSSPTPSSMPARSGGGMLGGNADAYKIVRRTEIPMEREAAALAVTMNIHGDVRSLSSGW